MTMNFNGDHTGGVANYVIGTQNIHGPQYGTVTMGDVRAAVRSLDRALATAPLPDDLRRAAQHHVRAVEGEVARRRPDKRAVADRLESLGKLLGSAGSVVTGGSAILEPLKTLAGWLGPLAAPLLALLPL